MKKEYPHADFLVNISGIPKHWFAYRPYMFGKDNRFWNAKTGDDLVITDGLTGVFHVMYAGAGLEVFKTKSEALAYAKKYMREN